MRILIYPHDMNMGGSQLNAIEIAAQVQRLGHEVIIFGQDGVLRDRVNELGLEFIEAPRASLRPTPSIVTALRRIVAEREIDIVHGYEWPPALEAALALGYKQREKVVSTVLSMSVAPFIPGHIPLMVGTEQIAAIERENKRDLVGLMEPPVDTTLNHPLINVQGQKFADAWNLDLAIPIVSVVSRLAHEMKLEGILSAIAVVEHLNTVSPLQLLVVGDGPARNEVTIAARQANQRMGSERIILTGQLDDPRPAYQLADIVLGMGGSALRAMAFQKPLIVQGEKGFWEILSERSLPEFLWQGWYGVGTGTEAGQERLSEALTSLLRDENLRKECAELSLSIVSGRFSLEVAAERQIIFYREAMNRRPSLIHYLASMFRATTRFGKYNGERIIAKIRGRISVDDFNATPAISMKEIQNDEVKA